MCDSYKWKCAAPGTSDAGWWSRWNALNVDGCAGHPLLESTFAQNAETYFGDAHVWRCDCTDSRGDVAMALLRKVSMLTWEVFQPSQAPLPFLVFRREIDRPMELLGALLRVRPVFPLRLQFTRFDAPYFLPIENAIESLDLEFVARGTTFAVSTGTTFEDYWGGRPKGLRKNIRRHFRRLEDEKMTWRVERNSLAADMRRSVQLYGTVESAGWKGRQGTAIHAANLQGGFYRDLLEQFAERGDAHVYSLWFGEQLAASRLIIAGRGTAVILKTTFNEEFARFAPGRLLLYLVLQDLTAIPTVDRVEFYTNANKDALEWASDQREMYALTIYRYLATKMAVDALNVCRRRLSRALDGVPESV